MIRTNFYLQNSFSNKSVSERAFISDHREFIPELIAFLACFSPLLGTYSLPFFQIVSFSELALVLLIVLGLIHIWSSKKRIIINHLSIYLIYSLIISLFFWVIRYSGNGHTILIRCLRDCLFFIFYGVICPTIIPFKKMLKWMKAFVALLFVGVVIQAFFHYIIGRNVHLWLSSLPLNYVISNAGELAVLHNSVSFRFESFLLEPSYVAYYVGFFLAVILGTNLRKNLSWAILSSFLLIVCGSFSGIIILAIEWACYYIFTKRYKQNIVHLLVIFAILSVAILFLVLTNTLHNGIWTRLSEILNPKLTTSGGHRIFRGFSIFQEYDVIEKIFGIGLGNTSPYLIESGLSDKYATMSSASFDYSSSFSYVLLSCGFIGFFIYWGILIRYALDKKTSLFFHCLIALVLLMLEDNISFSAQYFLMLGVMFASDRKRQVTKFTNS